MSWLSLLTSKMHEKTISRKTCIMYVATHGRGWAWIRVLFVLCVMQQTVFIAKGYPQPIAWLPVELRWELWRQASSPRQVSFPLHIGYCACPFAFALHSTSFYSRAALPSLAPLPRLTSSNCCIFQASFQQLSFPIPAAPWLSSRWWTERAWTAEPERFSATDVLLFLKNKGLLDVGSVCTDEV